MADSLLPNLAVVESTSNMAKPRNDAVRAGREVQLDSAQRHTADSIERGILNGDLRTLQLAVLMFQRCSDKSPLEYGRMTLGAAKSAIVTICSATAAMKNLRFLAYGLSLAFGNELGKSTSLMVHAICAGGNDFGAQGWAISSSFLSMLFVITLTFSGFLVRP